MNNIGFIGYGSMGSMLIMGLITVGNISPNQIIITRKNKERLKEIKDLWPEINITTDVIEVVKKSKYIFICVKSSEYINILNEIKSTLLSTQHIISIAGPVMINDMEKIINCKITKLMPTLISEVNEGITLICHNNKVTEADTEYIENMIGNFTKINRIDENEFGFACKFTSCGPGLYAAIFQEFVEAGLRHSDSLTKEIITKMVLQTLYGTVKLMIDENMDFNEVISRVATKGGITEEGVKVMESCLPQVFDDMFDQTTAKQKVSNAKVHSDFEKIL